MKVFGKGTLTRDPELKQTTSGKSVTTLSVACNRRIHRDQTDYFDVVVWGTLAENCAKYLKKGRSVNVIGDLQTRTWEDKNGQKRKVTEIFADEVEFLASGKREDNDMTEVSTGTDPFGGDDDLPF